MNSGERQMEAWYGTLHEAHWDAVCRRLRRMVDQDDVHDLAQQTFETAWVKRHRVPAEEPLGWLLNVATKHAMKHRRGFARRKETLNAEPPDDTVCGDEAVTCERLDLHRLFRQLPGKDRQILWHVIEDLSGDQLAKALGVKPDTARQQRSRALQRARALLKAATDTTRTGGHSGDGPAR